MLLYFEHKNKNTTTIGVARPLTGIRDVLVIRKQQPPHGIPCPILPSTGQSPLGVVRDAVLAIDRRLRQVQLAHVLLGHHQVLVKGHLAVELALAPPALVQRPAASVVGDDVVPVHPASALNCLGLLHVTSSCLL